MLTRWLMGLGIVGCGAMSTDLANGTQSPVCIDFKGVLKNGAQTSPFLDGNAYMGAGETQLTLNAPIEALLTQCLAKPTAASALNVDLAIFSAGAAAPTGLKCGPVGPKVGDFAIEIKAFDCMALLNTGTSGLGSLAIPNIGKLKVKVVLF